MKGTVEEVRELHANSLRGPGLTIEAGIADTTDTEA
jgi:hypothetical protein